MFTKEYLHQKLILTIIMGLLIWFAFGFLSQKEGISLEEAVSYSIANSNQPLISSYEQARLDDSIVQSDFVNAPYCVQLISSCLYAADIQKKGLENSSIIHTDTLPTNFTPIWRTQTYYNNLISVNDSTAFQYKTVAGNCISNQKAPLFYFILHTFSSLFRHHTLHYLGFWINALFMFLTGFVIFFIGKYNLKNGWIGIASALLFGFSIGGISSMLCTQPYIMLTFFVISSFYLHISFITKDRIHFGYAQLLILVNILGILTDYSYLLFSGVIGILFCIVLLFYGRIKQLACYLLASVVSICVAVLLYPAMLLHLTIKAATLCKRFDLSSFQIALQTNLVSLQEQLFVKNNFAIALLLCIMLIMAFLLKRMSLRICFQYFKKRIYAMEIEDLFLMLTIPAYLGILSLVFPTGHLQYLIPLLPLVGLGISYITYRLCHTITTSSYNSGLITIGFGMFICFLGITSNSPQFLFRGYAEKVNFANENTTKYCVFINSNTCKAENHLLELTQYENSLILDEDDLDFLKDDTTIQEHNQLLVYVAGSKNTDKTIDKLTKYGNYHFTKEVYRCNDTETTDTYVYQLSRK